MIKAVKVTNYRGESLTITLANPKESGLLITDIDGIGAPDTDMNISNLATSDGGLFTSARCQPREITISMMPLMKWNVEQARHLIYRYFPIKQPVTLEFQTTERTSTIVGYVSKMSPDVFSQAETCEVTIKCPDPYFHDISDVMSFVFSGSDPQFEFPFSNELDHFPVHVYHNYEFRSTTSQIVRGHPYYMVLPDNGWEVQFTIPGNTITNGIFTGTLRVHTIDGEFADGEIVITGDRTEEAPLYLRTDAKDKALVYNPQNGFEYWTAVRVEKQHLSADTDYTIVVPDRGTYHFHNPREEDSIYSFEISLKMTDGVVSPDEVSIMEMLYPALDGAGSAEIFNGEYDLVLKHFEYVDAELMITKTGEGHPKTHTDIPSIELSEVCKESEHSFEYNGDAETGMTMTLHANGPVDKVSIYDIATGNFFVLDTSKIASITGKRFDNGDEILISTQSGDKYVRLLRSGVFFNVINSLDRGSTWFIIRPGYNAFSYMVDSGIQNLDFKISCTVAYQGV